MKEIHECMVVKYKKWACQLLQLDEVVVGMKKNKCLVRMMQKKKGLSGESLKIVVEKVA